MTFNICGEKVKFPDDIGRKVIVLDDGRFAITQPMIDYLLEEQPAIYKKLTDEMIKSSRFYEAPKEEKPYEYDPDYDDL